VPTILEQHRERFRADPSARNAFEALEESAFVAGDWEGLVRLYGHRLTATDLESDVRERARVLFRLGQICEQRRGDPEGASKWYRAAVAVDPACRPALTELRRQHAEQGQWDVALQIAEAEAALEMASDERADLLASVGALWLERFDDAEQALVHYARALEQNPKHRAALAGAAEANQRLARARDAAAHWERLAALVEGAERARVLIAQAHLLAGALGETDRATELYRLALTHDPRNADALDALAAAAEREERWSVLADLQERRFDAIDDPERRCAVALAAGQLHHVRLGDLATARVWLNRAVEQGTSDANAYRALADLERERGDDPGLRRALARHIELSVETPTLSALLELASLHSDAGEDEAALALLRDALQLAPEDALVIEALSDSLGRLGRYEELADCLERRASLAASDPGSCASVLAELGALQETRLGDVEAARRSYERAMQTDPSRAQTVQALERIYRKAEAWEPLRALLEFAGHSGPSEDRAASLCALGELLAEHFEDRDAAVRAFEAALALDRGCAAAHRGRQRLAQEADDEDAVLVAYDHEAAVTQDRERLGFLVREMTRIHEARECPAAALAWAKRWVAASPEDLDALRLAARLHEDLGEHEALLDLLERLDPLLQSGEQAANRRRMGALLATNQRSDQAIAAYRSALEADPADVATLEALVELLEQAGRPGEVARARRNLAELLDGPRLASCLDALARLLEERLGDLPGAIDTLVRLAETDGAAADVEERLETLLDRTGRHEELAQRLTLRARSADDNTARELAERRACILLEQLSLFDEAVIAFREILGQTPDSGTARAGLERGLRASGNSVGLAEFLEDQAAHHPDPATRDRCSLERAVILEEVLDRGADAALVYQRLAEAALDPADRQRASARLETILERAGDWCALRALWEGALERSPVAERSDLHEQLGRLCRDRLGDADGAALHFEAAAALAPERAELWQLLALLYERSGSTDDLVRTLEAELETGPEAERELALRRRAAALCTSELNDADRSRRHCERILQLDPCDSTAGKLMIREWQESGRLDQVARLLERQLAALDGLPRDEAGHWAARRTSLRLRIAGLRAVELDDPDGAIAILEPALGEIGPQAAVAEPLADLYERAGYLDDLIDLCGRAAEACEAGSERATWLARLGESLQRGEHDREAADAYRRALSDRPDDAEVEAALRDLYRRLGETEQLVRLLEAELVDRVGPGEIPLRVELAKLLMGTQDRPADALVHLRRVVHLDPGHAEALEKGLELAEHLNRPQVVRELLDTALARPQAPSVRAGLLARRGRLRATDPSLAFEASADYREALSLDSNRDDVREGLRSLLETSEQWEGVLDCLYQQACNASPQARAELYERGADSAWEHLGPEAALPWLERLRRERPRHAAVVGRIAEAHRLGGRPHAQLRALEDQVELTADRLSRRDLHVERARLLERALGAPGRAARALEDARSLCPQDTEVLHHLDRLYRELGRHRDRAGVVEALLETAADRDRVALLCEAATLHSGPLADPRRTAQLLLHAVAETPKTSALHAELLRVLGDALHRAGPPEAWARCAEAELSALDPSTAVFAERRLELRRELAAFYDGAGRLDAALRHLRPLVDEAPDGFDTSGAHESALLRGLRIQGNPVELERCLAARLERVGDDAEGWLELARLHEEHLSSTAGAARAYRRVLDVWPQCLPALRGLRAAAVRLGEWEEVATTLEAELDVAGSDSAQARSALLQRLGDVAWERLGSTTRASRAYAAAIEAHPQNFEAHHSLERLLEAMEDWRGALDLYESEIVVLGEGDPGRRQHAWLRAGEIARDHTGDIERALRAYDEAAALAELPLERRLEHADLHRRGGDIEEFARVFETWCDDPSAPARSVDHLRLAETLEELGQTREALARAERAIEVDDEDGQAWRVAARLREADDDIAGAAEAWTRAAELARDGSAAESWLRAACLREHEDPAVAADLLRQAAACDPASYEIQAACAEVAWRLEAFEETEEAAARALDLSDGEADPSRRLELALLGGRAARQRGRLEAAARFFQMALEDGPRHPEALAAGGEAFFALGDLPAARRALEALRDHEDPDAACAAHHALLARCLASDGEGAAALESCETALGLDPDQQDAHELCVELHQEANRIAEGVAALERWAAQLAPAARAARLLEAAAWELDSPGREAAVERHLREALAADGSLVEASVRLASLLWEQQRVEDALEAASQGLDAASIEPEARAALALVRARALEQRGEREAAVEAYGVAASADPRCTEAATAQARLLRAAGDWRGAADALDGFARRNPADDPAGLADLLQQLGRLLAGPLEDVEGAVEVYRRAVELDPEHVELRVTLAQLLSHRSEDWRVALAQHVAALQRDPMHPASLRAVLRLAGERGADPAVADGLCLLTALGIASPEERERAAPHFAARIDDEGLADPVGEAVRRALQNVASEIGAALDAPPDGPQLDAPQDSVAAFRAAALSAEGELAAPGLLPLATPELSEVVSCVATLALQPDAVQGSGATLNALAATLGRRARRRVKRELHEISLEQIASLDFDVWRSDLRALAAARTLNDRRAELRTALVALACAASDRSTHEIAPTADLTHLLATCPEALRLLRRVVGTWLAELES
jgi:tetratricopeptide (TPR) repeat protein